MELFDFLKNRELDGLPLRTDVMENRIASRGSGGKKLLVAAALDDVGVILTRIEKDGRARFHLLGKLPDGELSGALVTVGTLTGIVTGEGDDRYIDFGCEKVELTPGMRGSFVFEPRRLGEKLLAAGLESGVTGYLLRELLVGPEPKEETHFVFGAQSALGYRGLKAAAGAICPELAITLELCPCEGVEQGRGPVLKIADRSLLADAELCEMLSETARAAEIPLQRGVFETANSAGAQVYSAGKGVKTAALAIPVGRYGSLAQTVCESDVAAALKLLRAVVC